MLTNKDCQSLVLLQKLSYSAQQIFPYCDWNRMLPAGLKLFHQALDSYFFDSLFPDKIQMLKMLPLQQVLRFSFHPLEISFFLKYSSSLSTSKCTFPFLQIRQVSSQVPSSSRLCVLVFSFSTPCYIINMSDRSFTTSKATLNVSDNFISVGQFIGSLFWLDVTLILAGIICWRIIWYELNKLKIWDLKYGIDLTIGKDSHVVRVIKALHKIIKNLSSLNQNYILNQCGFEAFTYLFFLKRFTHLMAILTITDICVLIPYQLYFNDFATFSLVSIQSNSNSLFRTFYTLWVTIAVLYSISEMKKYLRLMLKHNLLRGQKRLLNSLKTKTVLIRFAGEDRRIDPIQLKTRLIQKIRIQDSILGCIELENNSKKIEAEYQYKIYRIVKQIGIQNFHPLWRFFKEIKANPDEEILKRIDVANQNLKPINSFLVVFQNIDTAEYLVKQFSATKSIYELTPEFSKFQSQIQNHYNQFQDIQISVNWAQQACDIRWICMNVSEQAKKIKYILMNALSILLIIIGGVVMILSRSKSIINVPSILLPMMLSIINVTLRWLLSKSSEWENKHFQYEWHKKEMKVLIIFFIINVLGGSIVRDTLNLIDVLTTGWGWLELFGLIYRKPDGFFYYGYIINDVAFTVFSILSRFGDLLVEVFEANLTYQKDTLVRHKSKFGTVYPFRYGYLYSLNVLMFAIIFMYSASCPLIHFFGFIYFISMLYLYGYQLSVFHKYQETCSNLRLLEQACEYIQIIMISIIFLIGITMMFQSQYSSVLILYFWEGVILWLMFKEKSTSYFLKDYYTDQELKSADLTQLIRQWRKEYVESMKPTKVPY